MFDKLKTAAKGVQESVSEKVGGLQAAAGEKLVELAGSIDEITPVLESLGYTVIGARVDIALPPSASVGITGLGTAVDDELFDAVLAQHEGNRGITSVLKALRHVANVQAKVNIPGFQKDAAEITLGFPPSVGLMFTRVPPEERD